MYYRQKLYSRGTPMRHSLVKKKKLPNVCPDCGNHDTMGSDDGFFFAGMIAFEYSCEKCEIKWTAYFEYCKDVIENLGYKIQIT